jgi:hypothetical protein
MLGSGTFSEAFMDELSKLAAKTYKLPKPPGMMATGLPARKVKTKGRPSIPSHTKANALAQLKSNAARQAGRRITGRNVARSSTYSPA